MKTLRFRIKVSKLGTIRLPKDAALNDKEVDVIIMPNLDKPESNRKEFVILRDGNSNYRTQKKHCRRAELL